MNVFIPALYAYRWKYIGFVLLIISLIYFLAIEINLLETLADVRLSKWGIAFALTLILFSKEKQENDRINHIRIIAQQYAFQFIISITLALYVVMLIFSLSINFSSLDLVLIGLILNTVIFYSIKWYGPEDIQLNYKGPGAIVRENKAILVIWGVLTMITIVLILLVL